MDRKMSTASSKLRNLKEFLSSTRSLSTTQSQHQINQQNPNITTVTTPTLSTTDQNQMDNNYKKGALFSSTSKTKKISKNSMSLFNIMSATSKEPHSNSGNKRESKSSHRSGSGRPVSAAFDDLEPYGYSSPPPTKSISMFGLAPPPEDELSENIPCSRGYNYQDYTQCGTGNRANLASRNFAARLFHNIRSKFRKRRRDRNKIVDSKSTDFGSFLGDRMASPSDRSFEGSDDKSTHSSSARHPLKSSRSVDNVLESLYGSRRLRNVAFEFNDGNVNEPSRTAQSCSHESEEGDEDSMPSNRDNLNNLNYGNASDNVFEGSPCVSGGTGGTSNSNFLAPVAISGGSISPSSATSPSFSAAKPIKCLTKELEDLLHFGWYWAGLSKEEAEQKLTGQPDGAFVVRDSSSDHYLLSLSFNSNGRTLHTRIEYRNGQFSFYSSDADSFPTVAELIDHCIAFSELGVFCYSRARRSDHPSYPVRLTKPISRYTEVKSLLYLSRFVLRQYVRLDLIPQLPLPQTLIEFVSEQRYI